MDIGSRGPAGCDHSRSFLPERIFAVRRMLGAETVEMTVRWPGCGTCKLDRGEPRSPARQAGPT